MRVVLRWVQWIIVGGLVLLGSISILQACTLPHPREVHVLLRHDWEDVGFYFSLAAYVFVHAFDARTRE